jgi:ribosomal protein S18 acetylase RimI-like enzyme
MGLSEPEPAIGPPLTAAELPDAEALVAEAGWNQVAADWRMFLDLGTVHAVRTEAGRVVATGATLPYGDRFAWISMVLVAGDHRRRGLATRLMRRCIDEIEAEGMVAVLDATPAGRAVYHALGFEDAWSFNRLASLERRRLIEAPPSSDAVMIQPITDAAWPLLCAYDAAAFGADRGAVLARMRGRLPPAALFAARAGRVVGFLLGREGRTAAQLGPLMAADDAVAKGLLARALAHIDAPVYVDLADAKAGIRAWLETCGFAPQRPFTRMLYRRRAGFDDPARTFAVIGPEFG